MTVEIFEEGVPVDPFEGGVIELFLETWWSGREGVRDGRIHGFEDIDNIIGEGGSVVDAGCGQGPSGFACSAQSSDTPHALLVVEFFLGCVWAGSGGGAGLPEEGGEVSRPEAV